GAGRNKLAPAGPLRRLLPPLAILAGAIILFHDSPRGALAKSLSVPVLYLAWLFGRDLVLAAAPPRGRK
ncbi:MAG: hypothetical protein NTW86_04260, partial [Candidatus Sumerlaeota bacterium]|nr:hypothetical protein [Candidatus Sumerlaeota bacterium]